MASIILDTFIAYKFVKILSTPWADTEAFKLGIIDINGKILRKRSSLTSQADKSAYPSIFTTLCWNIKKILDRVPIINLKSRPAALVASIMLLRELCSKELSDPTIIDNLVKEEFSKRGLSIDFLTESASLPKSILAGIYNIRGKDITIDADLLPTDECFGHPIYKINGMCFIFSEARKIVVDEDAPVNSVGGGAIAGTSAASEPPGPRGGWAALQKIRRRKNLTKKVLPPQVPPTDR